MAWYDDKKDEEIIEIIEQHRLVNGWDEEEACYMLKISYEWYISIKIRVEEKKKIEQQKRKMEKYQTEEMYNLSRTINRCSRVNLKKKKRDMESR